MQIPRTPSYELPRNGSKAKRILLVGPYYYPATCFGGPVWVLRDLARGLATRGLDVQVLTTSANRPQNDPPRVSMLDGVTVHYERCVGQGSWFFSPGFARTARRLIAQSTVVHVHGVWSFPSSTACAVARALRKPYINAPHGSFDPWAFAHKRLKKRLYFSLIERSNLLRAGAVHCLTRRERDQVLKLVPQAVCRVVPNAVTIDPNELSDRAREEFRKRFPSVIGKRVVLFLSRIHPKKGLDILIPAFVRARAESPNTQLVIAGPDDGGYLPFVEKLVRDSGLQQSVTFTGLLDGQERLAAFDAADVFVLPSYSEGLPVVALEAMAFGKPLIITPECNIDDEVASAGAGLVVTAEIDSLATGLIRLIRDADEAREMGESARRLAQRKYTLDSVVASLVEVFDEVLAGHP